MKNYTTYALIDAYRYLFACVYVCMFMYINAQSVKKNYFQFAVAIPIKLKKILTVLRTTEFTHHANTSKFLQ